MAKFCRHCGSPLEEGQVCACQSTQAAPEAPVATAEAPAAAPAAGNALVNELKATLSGYWKSPKAAAAAVAESKSGMTIAGIFAGVNFLAVFFFLWRIIGMFLSLLEELHKTMGRDKDDIKEMMSEVEHPVFPMLLAGLGIAAIGILISALAIFIAAKINKKDIAFKKLVITEAVHSVVPTALLIVGIVLGLLLPALQFLVLALILVLWFVNICTDIRDVVGVQIMETGKSMTIYTLVTFAVLAVGVYLMVTIGGWSIGEMAADGQTLNETIEEIIEAMEQMGGLLGLFMGSMY